MSGRTLHERYHEVHALRGEGLERYGRLPYPQTGGPPARVFFPAVGRRLDPFRSIRLGPLVVTDFPPVAQIAFAEFARLQRPVRVLEIGPGRGTLAGLLRTHFPEKISAYLGLELDPHVEGPYVRVERIDAIAEPVDVVIASEVIEHIPSEAFFAEYLTPLTKVLAHDAVMIASTPNPLVPGGIVRDFTHVQNYPWYDLYALLRLAFERVDITRTHYVCNAGRLFGFVPRVLVTAAQELDWTEGLIAIARGPIPPG